MVQCLLDLQLGIAPAVDNVPIDHHEVRLLRVQRAVHQLDGPAVRLFVVLGVVELDYLELAVGAEGEAGLGRLSPRRRVSPCSSGDCDTQCAKGAGGGQRRPPAEAGFFNFGGHRCLSAHGGRLRFRPPSL
jgi:hypothetical protein